ncbi:MAG TPA: ATP-binding protein [Candidatus Dormibacteraeota bacterium]|nr:ATP-binding protein [Candidatus Dormibacteraeota bacterium]
MKLRIAMPKRRRTRVLLAGAPLYPIIALALVSALDQLDLAVFGVVFPEMKADLHFSLQDVFWIGFPASLLGWCGIFVIGALGDRLRRVTLSWILAAVFGLSSFLTGAVISWPQLVLLRTFSVLPNSYTSLHHSLIADIYPPEGRGFAMGLWTALRPAGFVAGSLLAGVLAAVANWRLAFLALSIPVIAAVAMLFRVREPARGAQEFEASTAAFASQVHLGPIQSVKLLLNIRSYRRLMWAYGVIGMGVGSLVPLSAFVYQGVFGVGPFGRGLINAVTQLMVFLSSVAAGALLQRFSPRFITLANGLLVSAAGLSYLFLALAPTAGLAVASQLIGSAAFGIFSVGTFLQVAATTPANIRTMAFAAAGIFMILGNLWGPIALGIGASQGYRVALLASFWWYIVGGLVVADGARFVKRDQERANTVLRAEAEARRRRAAGEKLALLDVRHLDVAYGNVQVLFDVSMQVTEGEIVALLGTNGAGKSTLLRTVSGLIRPTEGVVLFEGSDITGLDAELITKRGVIHVPGGRGVFPGLTVRRNLRLGTYLYRSDPLFREERMEYALSFFPRLGERLDQAAGSLSGGEQQMLNLAQAMMVQPRLLLIDELSLGLAPRIVEEILQVVESIAASGVTIVLVEQSVNIALSLASRAYFMEKGEVRFEGRSADLADRDDLVRSVFLAGAR